jgi:hypothetical protein
MGERIQMKMAKATPDDFDTITQFFNWLEAWAEDGTETIVRDGEEVDVEITDEAFVERMRAHMSRWTRQPNVLACWSRVVFGAQMLIANCCDPNLDHLEWRPDVLEFLEQQKAAAGATASTETATASTPELQRRVAELEQLLTECYGYLPKRPLLVDKIECVLTEPPAPSTPEPITSTNVLTGEKTQWEFARPELREQFIKDASGQVMTCSSQSETGWKLSDKIKEVLS